MDYRPAFHYAHRARWLNDPNGLIHLDGTWHLFSQTNPEGADWGNMSWGHATSPNLVDWTEHDIAIHHTDDIDIFSGSCIVDDDDDAGFGAGSVLAFFTGHHRSTSPDHPREDQRLAFSTDGASTFTVADDVNPVLTRHTTDFRDPKVFRWTAADGSRSHWVMVAVEANDQQLLIHTSTDLRTWKLASTFGPEPPTGVIWECPDLLELPTGNGTSQWVLLLSINPGAPHGAGLQYFVGDFDGATFEPTHATDGPHWIDLGPDHYATTSIAQCPPGRDGRPRHLIIGWMSNPGYAGSTPLLSSGAAGDPGGRNAMTLPRELSLSSGGRLRQRVPDEVRERLGDPVGGSELIDPLGLVTIDISAPRAIVNVGGLRIMRDATLLTVERPGEANTAVSRDFACRGEVSVPEGPLSLEAWVDHCSVEVFTPAGECLTFLRFPSVREPWRVHIFDPAQVTMTYRPITTG